MQTLNCTKLNAASENNKDFYNLFEAILATLPHHDMKWDFSAQIGPEKEDWDYHWKKRVLAQDLTTEKAAQFLYGQWNGLEEHKIYTNGHGGHQIALLETKSITSAKLNVGFIADGRRSVQRSRHRFNPLPSDCWFEAETKEACTSTQHYKLSHLLVDCYTLHCILNKRGKNWQPERLCVCVFVRMRLEEKNAA